VSGAVLIVFGVVFLLNSLGYWEIQDVFPYWPILMIALGAYLLYRNIVEQQRGPADDSRLSSGSPAAPFGVAGPQGAEPSWEERPGHE
jgi:hypothetical protein